jgi:hypothetical protein
MRKGTYLVECGDATEYEQACLRASNGFAHDLASSPPYTRIGIRQHVELQGRISRYYGSRHDCLGGEEFLVPSLKSEKVSRQKEVDDAPPPIAEQRVFPSRPRYHAIPIFRRIRTAVDLFAAFIRCKAPYGIDRGGQTADRIERLSLVEDGLSWVDS